MFGSPEAVTDGEWDWRWATAVCLREARRVLGAGSAAEDAAQEAVIRAWRHRRRCQTPESPGGWLSAIARREALRVAAQRSELSLEPQVEVEDPRTGADLAERLDVRCALRELTDSDRKLLLARYWADLTQPQVAELLRVAEGTVKVRLHRLRAQLRVALSTS